MSACHFLEIMMISPDRLVTWGCLLYWCDSYKEVDRQMDNEMNNEMYKEVDNEVDEEVDKEVDREEEKGPRLNFVMVITST